MRTKRPLPLTIIGIAGWLFIPLAVWLTYGKVIALIDGNYTFTLWAAIGDLVIMLSYMLSVVGYWRLKRWTLWLLIITTLIMAAGYWYFGLFRPRDYLVPIIVIGSCIYYYKHFR